MIEINSLQETNSYEINYEGCDGNKTQTCEEMYRLTYKSDYERGWQQINRFRDENWEITFFFIYCPFRVDLVSRLLEFPLLWSMTELSSAGT